MSLKDQTSRPREPEGSAGAQSATTARSGWADVLIATGTFSVAAAFGLLLGWLFGAGVDVDVGSAAVAAAISASVIILFARLAPNAKTHQFGAVVGAVFVAIGSFALLNAANGWADLIGYGDTGFLGSWMERADGPFSQWLGASGLLEWIYVALWRSPFLGDLVPRGPAGADLLVVVAGTVMTAACAVGVAFVYGRRFPFAVAFTLFSPVYLMFTLGYDEVYPLVAGPFVVFLFWFFSRPLEDQDPVAVGIWLGGLTVAYLPFVIPGSVIGLGTLVLRPRKALRMVVAGVATVVTGIVFFWPPGVADFFSTLHADLNLGDKHTFFPRFIGHASGPDSIFFDWRYALSSEHIADLTFMWFWSGAIVPIVAAAVVAAVLTRSRKRHGQFPGATEIFGIRLIALPPSRRLWMALILLAQQAHWVFFVIPKLGPRGDLDLFFSAYLLVAFLAGVALDRIWPQSGQNRHGALAVGMAYAGAACAAVILLVLVGIPPAYR